MDGLDRPGRRPGPTRPGPYARRALARPCGAPGATFSCSARTGPSRASTSGSSTAVRANRTSPCAWASSSTAPPRRRPSDRASAWGSGCGSGQRGRPGRPRQRLRVAPVPAPARRCRSSPDDCRRRHAGPVRVRHRRRSTRQAALRRADGAVGRRGQRRGLPHHGRRRPVVDRRLVRRAVRGQRPGRRAPTGVAAQRPNRSATVAARDRMAGNRAQVATARTERTAQASGRFAGQANSRTPGATGVPSTGRCRYRSRACRTSMCGSSSTRSAPQVWRTFLAPLHIVRRKRTGYHASSPTRRGAPSSLQHR